MFEICYSARLIWVGGKGGVGKTKRFPRRLLAVLAAQPPPRARCLVVSTVGAQPWGDVVRPAFGRYAQSACCPIWMRWKFDPDIEWKRI